MVDQVIPPLTLLLCWTRLSFITDMWLGLEACARENDIMASKLVCKTLRCALCHFQEILHSGAIDAICHQSLNNLCDILPNVASGLHTLLRCTGCKELFVMAIQQLLQLNVVLHAIQSHDRDGMQLAGSDSNECCYSSSLHVLIEVLGDIKTRFDSGDGQTVQLDRQISCAVVKLLPNFTATLTPDLAVKLTPTWFSNNFPSLFG